LNFPKGRKAARARSDNSFIRSIDILFAEKGVIVHNASEEEIYNDPGGFDEISGE
jgi:hypothetical protein